MKVLLIDDEEDIRKIAKLAMEVVGHSQVTAAASASEGIALAKMNSPDVILMDMMMPGMDGLTALAEIQKIPQLANIPILFMTAKVQQIEINNYLARGAIGVIQKPFDPMMLCDQICILLNNDPVESN